jgi:aspartyl-tRNA(Asn)/glutamyl-tRNA(Gln) amidotransferase subunit C
MPVTIADVEHIASLARLTFSDEEKEKLVRELNEILKYMEKLNELDTTNVEPLTHMTEIAGGAQPAPSGPAAVRPAALRPDEVTPSLPREEAMKNAPERTEKFFKVPKVL